MEKLQKFISAGSQKCCYGLPERRVVLTAPKSELLRERRALRQLEKLGFPVLQTTLNQYLDEKGEQTWGLEAPEYDFHLLTFKTARVPDPYSGTHAAFTKLRPGHLRTLERFRRRFKGMDIYVEDLQFLFAGTDEVVICDPYEVREGAGKDWNVREVAAVLRSYKMWVKARQQVVVPCEAA